MITDVKTEIECINMRLEILNEESQSLYKLLKNFDLMKDQPREIVRKAIMERLNKRKAEMKKELEEITVRAKVVLKTGQTQMGKTE